MIRFHVENVTYSHVTCTTHIFINTLTTMLIDLSFKEPNLSVALRQTTSVHSLCSLWAKEQDLSTVKHFQHFFSRMVGTSNKFQFCGAVVVVVSMCFIQPALLKKKKKKSAMTWSAHQEFFQETKK
jgi:hypothetical protein